MGNTYIKTKLKKTYT